MTNALDTTIVKWKSLVDKLTDTTNDLKITWKQSADEKTYITLIGSLAVSISEVIEDDFNNNVSYIIRLFNRNGEIADSFSDEDLKDYVYNTYTIKMRQLYKTIDRLTNGSEIILDDILKNLDKKY